MTTGTVHTFDARRGTGTLLTATGAAFPFSTMHADLAAGDRVSFFLTGGIAGIYALNVEPVAARAHSTTPRAAVPTLSLPWPSTRRLAMG